MDKNLWMDSNIFTLIDKKAQDGFAWVGMLLQRGKFTG